MPKFDAYEDIDRVLDEVREIIVEAEDAGDLDELVVLQMLLKVSKELHSMHSAVDVITKVLDSVIAFVDGDRAFLMLLDEENEPHFKMGRTANGDYLDRDAFSPSTAVLQEVMETRKTVIVPDAQADERFSKRDSVQKMSLRTIICSPLMIKRNLIGLLYVDSRNSLLAEFTNRANVNFLASLADQSAIAIQNAQKFETYTD